MSLSGSYQDFNLEMFKDDLSHELQQSGTLLLGTVTRESVGGVKTHFTKVGATTSYEKTQRGQLKNPQDTTFERRPITFTFSESDILVDVVDTMNMVANPQGDYIQSMKNELGRKIDRTIEAALSGSATVQANGSTTTVALPSTSKVVVADHSYDAGTGDAGLTPSKLKKALALLGTAHVDVTRERVFCIAPYAQLMALTSSKTGVNGIEVTSADYRNNKPLNIPGIVMGLDGYLGVTFIASEILGVDGSSNQLAYVYPQSAIKVGIRQDLTVKVAEDTTRAGNPPLISAWIDLGAVRMFEEKVIQIACLPVS